MKKIICIGLFGLLTFTLSAQNPIAIVQAVTPPRFFWLSGGIGGGNVINTNIATTGAVLPFRAEAMWQKKHRRLGIGIAKEIYLSPQALNNAYTNFTVKPQIGITKVYLVYEKFLFKRSPVNIGFSSNIGGFVPSDGSTILTKDNINNPISFFANAGIVLEVGIGMIHVFVRPDVEYQAWDLTHTQSQVAVTAGIRLRF